MSQSPAIPSLTATQVALRFVGDLQAGRRPSIETALDAVPSTEWLGVLQSLLIAEVNYRRSRGETPAAREYLPRFPAHTSIVRSVLPDAPPAARPVPIGRPAAEQPSPVRPSVPVAQPLASSRNEDAPPPMAIVLSNEFGGVEPRPDPGPGRLPHRRRRLLAVASLFVVLAGVACVIAIPRVRKPHEPGRSLPPPVSKSGVTTAPKIPSPFQSKPVAADPERDLAEWIAGVGGRGTLAMDAGGRRPFGPGTPLPKAKFAVVGLSLPAESSSRWAAVDLGRLRGRDKLTSVELHHPTALNDWVLEVLSGSPLKSLALHGTTVAVAGAGIARFSQLESLTILSAPLFSDADLAAIAKLTRLGSLTLNAPKLTPAGLGQLRMLPLRSLTFGDDVTLTPEHTRMSQGLPLEEFESQSGTTDDAILEFSVVQSLKRLRLHRTKVTDAGLKVALGLGMLEELKVTGSSITGPGLEDLSERKKLKVLDLTDGKVNDEGVEKLLALPALRELRLAGCPVTDRGIMLIARLDGLQVLDLSRTRITDAALGILKKHQTLKSLTVTGTRVTAAGITDFERGTPNCKVTVDVRK